MCDLWICQESLKCRTSSDDLKAKWQYPNRFDKPHRSFQIVPADSKSQNTCMFEQKHPTANRNAQYCTTTVFLLKCTCCIIYIYIYMHTCVIEIVNNKNAQRQHFSVKSIDSSSQKMSGVSRISVCKFTSHLADNHIAQVINETTKAKRCK